MVQRGIAPEPESRSNDLLGTLEQLLSIEVLDLKSALDQASNLVSAALKAEKVDIFVHDVTTQSLVARGTSNTPMGRLQVAIGLDRQPIANGGRAVQVFQTGQSWREGHTDEDPEELLGIKQGLGVRSEIAAPLDVNGERRGALVANSTAPDRFSMQDLRFLEAVAGWIGILLHRSELVEASVRDAKEQARQVAADELVTILAHDLRGPLTPLRGRLEMIRGRAQREGQAANVRDAMAGLAALGRVDRLIGDLLDTARLEQGIFALNVDVVDLAALVRETVETLRSPENDIQIRVPDELPTEVDSLRVRQALENLLNNARTHAPAGAPIVVELDAEQREDGEWAVLSVRDSGPGISPELMPDLFTRFTSRGTKGLGLGLYLARGIAEA